MNSAICEAIRTRSVLEIYYNGGPRTVEPHCHGISRAGNEVVLAYQTGGHSDSEPVAWKLFDVGLLRSLRSTGQTFTTNRPGYQPFGKHMTSVHCHV